MKRGHKWRDYLMYGKWTTICQACGVVQNEYGTNNLCRGKIGVSLRGWWPKAVGISVPK